MTGRKCSTCKHYEPAPIWRKGWCRNPLLYSPQQSHLVGEDDLDCERGMGNYWEPSDASRPFATVDADGFQEPVSDAFAAVAPDVELAAHSDRSEWFAPPIAAASGRQFYAISGGSIGDPPGDEPPIINGGGGPGGRDRQLAYYSEDRYWTDYLRILAPIIGVLLMVGLFWFWASSFLDDDDNNNNPSVGAAQTQTSLPTIGSTPNASPSHAASASPTLRVVGTALPTATTPSDAGTGGEGETPAETGGGDIANGATVQITGTGGVGANLRSDATTSEDNIVATLLDGTVCTVTGDSVSAEDYVWWPVSCDDGDGYIVQDYLEVAQ